MCGCFSYSFNLNRSLDHNMCNSYFGIVSDSDLTEEPKSLIIKKIAKTLICLFYYHPPTKKTFSS